jgi:hypothetical protein
VSRFLLGRCSNTAHFLGDLYCPIAHAVHLTETDTILDAMLMDVIPEKDRLAEVAEAWDQCPYKPRRRRISRRLTRVVPAQQVPAKPSQPWKDHEWRLKLAGLSCAAATAEQLCCASIQVNRSRTSSNPVRGECNDLGDNSQAFLSAQLEVFTAGSRRASPPVRSPAR